MSETDLGGVIPIVYSTFTDNGEIDYESLRRQVRTLLDDGCHGLALFGLASEHYKLTDGEREAMTDIVVDLCEEARTPSVVSVTHHATEVAIERARAAERAGANYLMLLPPFILGPSEDQVYEHAKRVANAVSTPVVFQYAPDHTGGECSILIGQAGHQLIEAYDRGAAGVLPGAGYYDVYLEIERRYRNDDRAGAVELHNDLLALLNHTTQNLEMAIAYGKRALRRRGIIDSAYCRSPSFEPDQLHDDLFDEHYAALEMYGGDA